MVEILYVANVKAYGIVIILKLD